MARDVANVCELVEPTLAVGQGRTRKYAPADGLAEAQHSDIVGVDLSERLLASERCFALTLLVIERFGQ